MSEGIKREPFVVDDVSRFVEVTFDPKVQSVSDVLEAFCREGDFMLLSDIESVLGVKRRRIHELIALSEMPVYRLQFMRPIYKNKKKTDEFEIHISNFKNIVKVDEFIKYMISECYFDYKLRYHYETGEEDYLSGIDAAHRKSTRFKDQLFFHEVVATKEEKIHQLKLVISGKTSWLSGDDLAKEPNMYRTSGESLKPYSSTSIKKLFLVTTVISFSLPASEEQIKKRTEQTPEAQEKKKLSTRGQHRPSYRISIRQDQRDENFAALKRYIHLANSTIIHRRDLRDDLVVASSPPGGYVSLTAGRELIKEPLFPVRLCDALIAKETTLGVTLYEPYIHKSSLHSET